MTVSRVLDEPEDPTEARFRRVALAVVAILIARGPTEIRIASVSRRSGVSRAWIYKQFGKDTTALLDFTIRELGAVFAGIDAELDSSSVNAWIDSVELETRRGFSDAQQAPWVPALYFRYRHTPGPLGDAVRVIETRHLRRFVDSMPDTLLTDRSGAHAFAEVFTAARLGAYAWWGETPRKTTVDEAARHLFQMLRGWAR
jgi:AcrR family transcriptional regulator